MPLADVPCVKCAFFLAFELTTVWKPSSSALGGTAGELGRCGEFEPVESLFEAIRERHPPCGPSEERAAGGLYRDWPSD